MEKKKTEEKRKVARSAIIITGDRDASGGRNTELPAQHTGKLGKGLVASCLNQR